MFNSDFEWDEAKNRANQAKHGVSFNQAEYAFADANRIIAEDAAHSWGEKRYFCFGLDRGKTGVLTVRFTYRNNRIRILGAGYWRRGRKTYYERKQRNSLYR